MSAPFLCVRFSAAAAAENPHGRRVGGTAIKKGVYSLQKS